MKIGTLFSGLGAPEFALKSMGVRHEIKFACDIDKSAKATYLMNHKCHTFYDDINEIKSIPQIDLLTFGFPCQPFSYAGKRLGMGDERGCLVFKALSLIKDNKPKFIIAENVKGFETIGKDALKYIIKELMTIGYNVNCKVLNSINFGIPQNRSRLWIIASLNKHPHLPEKNSSEMLPLSYYLKTVPDDDVFATRDFLNKPKVIKKLKEYNKPYINCITRTISRNGSSSEYINYVAAVNHAIGQKRKPTISECCKLFGLPDDFIFPDNICKTKRYEILANSMVVSVLTSIMKELL